MPTAGLLLALLLGLPVAAALAVVAISVWLGIDGSLAALMQATGGLPEQVGVLATYLGAFTFWRRMIDFTDIPARLYRILAGVGGSPAKQLFALVWALGTTGSSGRGVIEEAVRGRTLLPAVDGLGLSRTGATALLGAVGVAASLVMPSLPLVIFVLLDDDGILRAALAGLIPAAVYLIALTVLGRLLLPHAVRLWPRWVEPEEDKSGSWKSRRQTFLLVAAGIGVPAFCMIVQLATPQEAAVLGAVLLAILGGGLTDGTRRTRLAGLCRGAIVDVVRIMLVVIMAFTLSGLILNKGSGLAIAQPYMLLVLMLAMAVLLGAFMEASSAAVIAVVLVVPLAAVAAFDRMWAAIVLVVAIEFGRMLSAILFSGYAEEGTMGSSAPVILLAAPPTLIAVLVAYPELVLMLPRAVMGNWGER